MVGRDLVRLLYRALQFVAAIPNSVVFNATYFPFPVCLRLPVLVSHRVRMARLGGSVNLSGPIRFGSVRVGFGNVGIFDSARRRSIWRNEGHVSLGTGVRLGHGTRICVGPAGRLNLGDDVRITAESAIVCNTCVEIGPASLISWEVLLMDDDFHGIFDSTGNRINNSRPIHIGAQVWIGCRVTILKGTEIGDGSVVASGSVLSGRIDGDHVLLAGPPPRVLRKDIHWAA